MKTTINPKGAPGSDRLFLFDEYPRGEKCEHNRGGWCVEWRGKTYSIESGLQLQKDFWLGCDGASEDMLRWFCHECGTIQQP